jgi:hypothetical protein
MRLAFPASVLLTAALGFAQAPPSASDLVNTARSQANGRAVWVIFHASW